VPCADKADFLFVFCIYALLVVNLGLGKIDDTPGELQADQRNMVLGIVTLTHHILNSVKNLMKVFRETLLE
jgi:hypothetical protein